MLERMSNLLVGSFTRLIMSTSPIGSPSCFYVVGREFLGSGNHNGTDTVWQTRSVHIFARMSYMYYCDSVSVPFESVRILHNMM